MVFDRDKNQNLSSGTAPTFAGLYPTIKGFVDFNSSH